MSIHSLVPDAKALLDLEPEELAGVLMEYPQLSSYLRTAKSKPVQLRSRSHGSRGVGEGQDPGLGSRGEPAILAIRSGRQFQRDCEDDATASSVGVRYLLRGSPRPETWTAQVPVTDALVPGTSASCCFAADPTHCGARHRLFSSRTTGCGNETQKSLAEWPGTANSLAHSIVEREPIASDQE